MIDESLMLSVSGLRGVIGRALTPPIACQYAAAFGQWLRSQGNAAVPHVVLGRDSRTSGKMLELAVASGLIGVGCRVTCLDIVTTPSVAIMTQQLRADGGMVITASHNPAEWNGIKPLRCDGAAPSQDQAIEIVGRFKSEGITYAAVEGVGELDHNDSTHCIHVERILKQIDVGAIRDRKLKVVLDSVHGAGGPATALLLRELGVTLVHLFEEPTGRFPHTAEPSAEALSLLCESVRKHEADIGLAQDPDADRLAVVDEKGQYIGEEYTLALAAWHVLGRSTNQTDDRVLVTNLSTSRMIDDIATDRGARVLRTPVGEANVSAAMRRAGAILGGEGNGGVILPSVVYVRDSLTGIGIILEMLVHHRQPLTQILDRIPRYAIAKDKAMIPDGLAARLVPLMQERFADQRLDLQDGVRVDWSDRWVHVRSSNTEPILRFIAEARDSAAAWQLIEQVREVLGASSVG